MDQLDRTEQRIVGTLIEKQFTVPDAYPLTENALLAGCNQKSNRDPVMALESFEVRGALMALHEKEVVARVEGGGRVAKYRQKVGQQLSVGDRELAVLAELLLRGAQAPGALKPRVARMGFHGGAPEVEHVLRELAAHTPPLVQLLPRRPRERDARWQHLLGDVAAEEANDDVGDLAEQRAAPASPAAVAPDLAQRITALEQRLAALEARLAPPLDD